jgi:hypothetical protein
MTINHAPQETSREVMMIEVDWRVPFIDFNKDYPPASMKKALRQHASLGGANGMI